MNFFKRTMLKSIKTHAVTNNYAPQTCENGKGKNPNKRFGNQKSESRNVE